MPGSKSDSRRLPPLTHRGVVVLAEDDHDLRMGIEAVLEDAGYLVLTARDGGEALARLRRITARAVALVDLVMPDMDGRELIAAMRASEDLRDVPVVVLTGLPCAHVEGADRVLHKPCPPDELLEAIAALLVDEASSAREP